MDVLLLHKSQLSAFVAALLERYRVFAPVRRDGELRFDRVATPDEPVLDYRNTVKAPKGIILPQTDTLVRFGKQRDDHNPVQATPFDETPTVILGIRPCDAQSLIFLDSVFGQGRYADPYYQARREHTLVFTLACDRPRPTCFCHWLGLGPYDRGGADVFMREAGDAYLLEAVSERGAEALAALHLPPADAGHLERAQEVEAAAHAQLCAEEPVADLPDLLPALYDSPLWQEISEKCLGCGTCTYICPMCHCFTIEDRVQKQGGERVRAWDSCMYAMYTQHASGHNPRPNQSARWRQRVMHKFQYSPRNAGLYGCTGCGRCVAACPVCMDIRQVIRRVRDEATEGTKGTEGTEGSEGSQGNS